MDADNLYRLIGERIRDHRITSGLSQAKLADQLEMTRASVVNIEAGRQRTPVHVLWRIAEVLSLEISSLIPNQLEYSHAVAPINLDAETIAEIERAASGDAKTKRQLSEFISKARTLSRSEQ